MAQLLSQSVFEAIIPGWFPGVGQWPGDHYGKDIFLSSQILTTGRNMWIADLSKADIIGDHYLSPSSPSTPTGNSCRHNFGLRLDWNRKLHMKSLWHPGYRKRYSVPLLCIASLYRPLWGVNPSPWGILSLEESFIRIRWPLFVICKNMKNLKAFWTDLVLSMENNN